MRARIRSSTLCIGFLLGVSITSACSGDAEPLLQPREIPCPAPPGSAEVNLFAGRQKLYLSWLAKTGETHHALQFTVLEEGKWSSVRTIAQGERFFANWADFPSVVELTDGSCAAHWLRRRGPGRDAYDVMVARSRDGIVWGPAVSPHRDGTETEHGFASLVSTGASSLGIAWLDGRAFVGKEEHDPSAEMHLMWSEYSGSRARIETLLDGRVCDCCQTAAVATSRGVLVAYRDRSENEVRDIFLVRRDASGWTKPYVLAQDGWQISGCPVNGPSLDSIGNRVVAAWFTMRNSEAVVQVAFSQDGGATFSDPRRIDEGQALGRVDVVLLPSGGALVVWMETTKTGEASILARRVGEGEMEPSFQVAAASANRSSGFPRVARVQNTLYFAWTDAGEVSRVRLAALEIPSAWRK